MSPAGVPEETFEVTLTWDSRRKLEDLAQSDFRAADERAAQLRTLLEMSDQDEASASFGWPPITVKVRRIRP